MKCKYLESHLCIRANGQYRMCCVSTELDNIENVKTHSPEEWLNSKTITEAKEQFSKGLWPDSCIKCKKKEEQGLESKRNDKKNLGPGITYLDLRFGNSCNLKCISCWPLSSSSIANESKEMQSRGIVPIYQVLKESNFNWNNEDAISQLLSYPVKEVYLTGGEPMMVKYLPSFLERLDKSIVVRFNTNGTIWNKEVEKILKKFQRVKMDISIDAIGHRAEYIRFGTVWNTVEENVKRYQQFCEINITPTLSVLNSAYMLELKDWANFYNLSVVNNLLDNPKWLNVKNAPEKLKVMFQETNGWEQGVPDPIEIQKFREYIIKLDSFRKVKIKEFLPEVATAYDLN